MSFQTYIDNIHTKTGKTPEDFLKDAEAKGMVGPDIKVSRNTKCVKANRPTSPGKNTWSDYEEDRRLPHYINSK